MIKGRILGAIVGGVIVAAAGVATATSLTYSRQSDFVSPGNHEFYVWCAGGSDYMAEESGANAEDAQLRLYNAVKAGGKTNCWPVWQGRLS